MHRRDPRCPAPGALPGDGGAAGEHLLGPGGDDRPYRDVLPSRERLDVRLRELVPRRGGGRLVLLPAGDLRRQRVGWGVHSTYTNQSARWALPQTVAATVSDDLWTTVNYSFAPPNASDVDGYDYSIDDFFTETVPPVFEHGPFVEVMVWFAHHIIYPPHFLHWSAPTFVNGTVSIRPWQVAYWCHGAANGTNANVSFDFAYGNPTSLGVNAGTVGVNISGVLSEVEALMPSVMCWTGPTGGFAQFHLDEANLGSEDGAVAGSDYNYNWTVDQYLLPRPRGRSVLREPLLLRRPFAFGPRRPAAAGRGTDVAPPTVRWNTSHPRYGLEAGTGSVSGELRLRGRPIRSPHRRIAAEAPWVSSSSGPRIAGSPGC